MELLRQASLPNLHSSRATTSVRTESPRGFVNEPIHVEPSRRKQTYNQKAEEQKTAVEKTKDCRGEHRATRQHQLHEAQAKRGAERRHGNNNMIPKSTVDEAHGLKDSQKLSGVKLFLLGCAHWSCWNTSLARLWSSASTFEEGTGGVFDAVVTGLRLPA